MNFGNGVAKILTKSMREETQVMYGRIWISVIPLPKFFLPEFDAQLPSEVPAWGVAKRKPIVATKFSKMGGGKKKKKKERERETNCGNQVAKILREWGERK